jgi:NADH-quinone oxidoreductase subunit I
MNWYERLYLWEVGRGMIVTIRHMVENIFRQKRMPTVQWPEEPKLLPARIKGRHRLTVREDNSPKCVACFMCATSCPARCIHIEAEESDDPTIEKRPKVFDIDILRCVFCGYCVEACPEDAIRMDTGEVTIVSDCREDFVLHIDFLLHGNPDDWKKGKKERELEERERINLQSPPEPEGEEAGGYRPQERPPVPSRW